MALKALLLRSKISALEKQLEAERAKDNDYTTREAALAASITELGNKPDATEDERTAVDNAVTAFDAEKAEHEKMISELDESIQTLNKELADEEAAQPAPAAAAPAQPEEGRKNEMAIETRKFHALSMEERSAFCKRDNVAKFITDVRTMLQTRAVTNTDLLIPTELQPLLTDSVEQYSKLMRHVNILKM